MNKQIIVILVVLAVLVGAGALGFLSLPGLISPINTTDTTEGDNTPGQSLLNLPQIKLPGISNPLTKVHPAWRVWEEYLKAVHAHDLTAVTALSYQLSATCQDTTAEEACFARMDNVYTLGHEWQVSDFPHIFEDDMQVILASDFVEIIDPESGLYGQLRAVIYFTKEDGEIKILGMNPADGAFAYLDNNTTEEELKASIAERIIDTDQDSIADAIELCQDTPESCVPTNPNLRDTDGDGWWDSIEVIFY